MRSIDVTRTPPNCTESGPTHHNGEHIADDAAAAARAPSGDGVTQLPGTPALHGESASVFFLHGGGVALGFLMRLGGSDVAVGEFLTELACFLGVFGA